jgi:hypothetical protein
MPPAFSLICAFSSALCVPYLTVCLIVLLYIHSLAVQDMLNMYRENRLDPSTMLCATHRAAPGQQQMPPPPETFKPLHALMHTVSTPGQDMHGQQAAASVPGTPAAGGMVQQQMVPAGMILAQAPGSVGPVLFQVRAGRMRMLCLMGFSLTCLTVGKTVRVAAADEVAVMLTDGQEGQ